jgi:hypothetical protein
MKNLSIYSPAEVLFLKNPNQRNLGEPLKLTLFDLLLKQVLTATSEARKTNPNDPETKLNYIAPGPRFNEYKIQPHELFFTIPFIRMSSAKILFRHLVQIAFDSAKSSRNYLNILFKGKIGTLVKHKGWRNVFMWYSLNHEGKKINALLQEEITALDTMILEKKKDPQLILDYAAGIHGNICMLPSVSLSMFQEIERLFPADTTNAGSTGGCTSSCGSWSSFDSSCSSGCGSNGCSGSACSSGGCSSGCGGGCSGCGGGCS